MATDIKKTIPRLVETADQGMIYDSARNLWYPAYQSVFRVNPDAAEINISAIGMNEIIPAKQSASIRIINIFFTVAAEVNVRFYQGQFAISGPMDFGGDGEPRGIVIPYPYAPLGLYSDNSFIISLSAAVQVSGSVCYWYQ
jgi:hypothetical protein